MSSGDIEPDDLFGSFGLANSAKNTTSTPASKHTRFEDSESDTGSVKTTDETRDDEALGTTEPSGSAYQETGEIADNGITDDVIETETLDVPIKFLNFLDNVANDTDNASFGEKLDYLMKSFERDRATKLSSGDSGFIVDRKPQEETSTSVRYDNSFSLVFDGSNKVIEIREEKVQKKMCCFNCNGEHTISECTEPRNEEQIRKNKSLQHQQNPNPKRTQDSLKRYAEDNARSTFRPGVISDNLRIALRLRADEAPLWVYQMRVLGYPPGYLVDALAEPLAMYGDDGIDSPVAMNKSKNEGEEKRRKLENVSKKIIEYPGFNVPLAEGTIDMHSYYHMPPMLPHQQKEKFAKYIATGVDNVSNIPRRNSHTPVAGNTDVGMDVCVEDPPPLPTTPLPPALIDICTTDSSDIGDLEREKQKILAQLGNLNSSVNDSELGSDLRNDNVEMEANVGGNSSTDAPGEEISVFQETKISTPIATVRRTFSAHSLSVVLGTPTMSSPNLSATGGSEFGSAGSSDKPSLQCFSSGIGKFECADASVASEDCGIKKIKEILKSRRKL